MYIDNENFEKWMEKLSKKLTEIGQDLKSLINTDTVFDENERCLFVDTVDSKRINNERKEVSTKASLAQP